MLEPTHAHRSLPAARLAALFAAPLVILGVAYGTPTALYYSAESVATTPPAAVEVDGRAIFAQNCAYCHGERGDGNGPAHVDPRARYFGAEKYKFASTMNAMPTDADIASLLRRGIPGSAMPAFPKLSDADVDAVIGHVRQLTRRGREEELVRKAERARQKTIDDGEDDKPPPVNVAKILAQVEDQLKLGAPLAMPAEFPPATADVVARGRKTFLLACAGCHGPEGKGDGPQVNDAKFVNDNGTRAKPRNLTEGVFKGGREPQNIYARIMLGIPGTPMPASSATLKPGDVQDLARYVLSLSVQ